MSNFDPSTPIATRFLLEGRIALVTGGSRGLGREIVRAFAQAGAHVVIASRRYDSCRQLAHEVEATIGREAFAYAFHVGKWDEIGGLVAAAYGRFGKVDVLVNNAGMSPLYDRPVEITESLFDKVLAVNLKGPFRLSAVVGTRMAESGGGSIINVGSVGAVRPNARIIPYAAAKAGVNAMTIGFAHAFGPTVRVNCIMPGSFRTDVSKAWPADSIKERERNLALQRLGRPDEVVGAALYLASDASSYTTGAIISVDGGMA